MAEGTDDCTASIVPSLNPSITTLVLLLAYPSALLDVSLSRWEYPNIRGAAVASWVVMLDIRAYILSLHFDVRR